MAIFLTSIKSTATMGEKRFAKLLELHLDKNYLVWFDLPTNSEISRFPDFLIFNPKKGLWCIEIKDWYLSNLEGANKKIVKMKKGDITENRSHPSIQARDSLFPVLNKLQTDQSLLQPDGKHQGKLAIPWGYGAVMSNWKKSTINRKKEKVRQEFYQCFPENQIFFKEEISEDDGMLSKQDFLEKLHGLLPYQFGNGLSEDQAKRVRAYIFPEFVIEQYHLSDVCL